MGLEPTRYRCASEALLRRFRKRARCRGSTRSSTVNATSLAFAIPVAAFDVSELAEFVEVRHATGEETYLSFSGELERPEPREVIFADAAGQAHARRWTNRQSALSAVRETTTDVLVVAEALHESAGADVERLATALADDLKAFWSVTSEPALLTAASPRFDFRAA